MAFIKENKMDGMTPNDIIDFRLLRNHTFVLNGEINEQSVEEAIRWLLFENIESENKELVMYINSVGGNLQDAFALIDVMRLSQYPIRTIGIGNVLSSGFLIFAAGTKGRRFISKNTSIMCHQYSDSIDSVKHHDIKSFAKESENTNLRMMNFLKEASGLNASVIKKKLLPPTDVWLTAEELVELGIADHIL